MDAFERRFPHLKWNWPRRKWFMLRYDIGMAISYMRTRWWQFRAGQRS